MAEWIRCPKCGRELPITMFSHGDDGHRRDICKRCQTFAIRPRERYVVSQDEHHGAGTKWTRADNDVLDAAIGRTIDEVAKDLGRTPEAVSWQIRRMKRQRVVDGRIAARDPA